MTKNTDNHSAFINISTMGLDHTLYFSMEFTYTKVQKKGLLNKFKKHTHPMDIDIACLLFDGNKNCIETVWFKNLRDKSEAIRHKGDDLHGHRPNKKIDNIDLKKDLEQIELRLDKLTNEAKYLALIVSSYTGDALKKVNNGKINLDDENANQAMAVSFENLPNECHTLWAASLKRENNDWFFKQMKQPIDNCNPKSLDSLAGEIGNKL